MIVVPAVLLGLAYLLSTILLLIVSAHLQDCAKDERAASPLSVIVFFVVPFFWTAVLIALVVRLATLHPAIPVLSGSG